MIVHSNQARDYGVVVEVDDLCVGVGGRVFGDAGDLSVFNEDVLVFDGGSTSPVDDADVGKKNRRGVDFDVLENVGRESGGLSLKVEGEGKGQD
jgi:hypothetical protein